MHAVSLAFMFHELLNNIVRVVMQRRLFYRRDVRRGAQRGVRETPHPYHVYQLRLSLPLLGYARAHLIYERVDRPQDLVRPCLRRTKIDPRRYTPVGLKIFSRSIKAMAMAAAASLGVRKSVVAIGDGGTHHP